ncbi:MAG: hypothetical protein N2450_06295 [bacterium]|nr:hypothetical protein [bacterium]
MSRKYEKKTYWNLVTDGFASLVWLNISEQLSNSNLPISNALARYKQDIDSNHQFSLFNPGILFAYSYIALVYPVVTNKDEFLNNFNLDYREFKIIKQKDRSKSLLRYLSHSISHGEFILSDDLLITFYCSSADEIEFEAAIKLSDFGKFLNNFVLQAVKIIRK